GRAEQYLVHGNLRGLRRSILSCRNPQTLAACRTASAHLRRAASERPAARHDRPRDCRGTEQRDELAALHSITSSARSRNDSGIVRPSVLAVLRLTSLARSRPIVVISLMDGSRSR